MFEHVPDIRLIYTDIHVMHPTVSHALSHGVSELLGVQAKAGLTDHASLFDRARDRSGGLKISIADNVEKLKDCIAARVDSVESDWRRVRDEDKAAELQLLSELDALSAIFSEGHDKLSNSVAALSAAFMELQGSGPASRPPPSPGIGSLDALVAQVIGLDSDLRMEKGRTDRIGSATEDLGQRSNS